MKEQKILWSKPTIVALSNNVIQSGTGLAYFETVLACSGPAFGGASANPGTGNDPDCTGAVTGYATYAGGDYVGFTGTMGVAATGSCFGACS